MELIMGSESDVAVLITHHKKNKCKVTCFKYAKSFHGKLVAPKKALLSYNGGSAMGRKCGTLHHHGFENIQGKVEDDITAWIASDATN